MNLAITRKVKVSAQKHVPKRWRLDMGYIINVGFTMFLVTAMVFGWIGTLYSENIRRSDLIINIGNLRIDTDTPEEFQYISWKDFERRIVATFYFLGSEKEAVDHFREQIGVFYLPQSPYEDRGVVNKGDEAHLFFQKPDIGRCYVVRVGATVMVVQEGIKGPRVIDRLIARLKGQEDPGDPEERIAKLEEEIKALKKAIIDDERWMEESQGKINQAIMMTESLYAGTQQTQTPPGEDIREAYGSDLSIAEKSNQMAKESLEKAKDRLAEKEKELKNLLSEIKD